MLRLSAHRSAGVCRAGPGAAGSLRPPGPGPSPSLLPRSLISRSGWKRSNRCRLRRCGMGTAAVVPRAPHRARGRRGRTARGRHRAAVLCQRTSLKNSFPSFFLSSFSFFPSPPKPPSQGPPLPPQHRGCSRREIGEQKREGSAWPRGAGTRGDFRSFDRSSVPSFAEASNNAFAGERCPRTHSPENISHLLKYSRGGPGDAQLCCALIYCRNGTIYCGESKLGAAGV